MVTEHQRYRRAADPRAADQRAADPPLRTIALMRMLGRRLRDDMQHRLASAGHGNLTAAQVQLLPLIGAGGARITSIAEQAGVSKQAIAALVEQLARAGYAERVPDPADARAKLVRLTGQGCSALAAAGRAVDDMEREWAAAIGERRLLQLRATLTALLGPSCDRRASSAPAHRDPS